MAISPGRTLVRTYEHARARVRKTEDRDLTPKEFLDLIDPTGKRSESSAKRYMRKLATGERKGTFIERRAHADSGRTVNVRYKVGEWKDPTTGEVFEDVRSANVTIPMSKSRLDFWKGDRLRKAVDQYLQNSYTRRIASLPTDAKYEALSRLPREARITEIRRINRARFPTQILR